MTDLPTLIRDAGEARAVLFKACPDYAPGVVAANIVLREALDRLATLARAAEGMAEALEPFATEAAVYDPDEGDSHLEAWVASPLIGELRTARTALQTYSSHHPHPAAQASGEPQFVGISHKLAGVGGAQSAMGFPITEQDQKLEVVPDPSAPGHPAPGAQDEPEAFAEIRQTLYAMNVAMISELNACNKGDSDQWTRIGRMRKQLQDKHFAVIKGALFTARSEGRAAGLEEAAGIAEADCTPAYGPHEARMEWFAETQRAGIAQRIRAAQNEAAARPQDREVGCG